MNEDILSFIWRFQYFQTSDLQTGLGEAIHVLRPGHRNSNSGPDFSEVRIAIDGVEWIGCVEIHVLSSDWFLHQHETNQSYESVVLHVVWENDTPVHRKDGTLLPTLALKGLVRLSILDRYRLLQDEKESIPCAKMFGTVNNLQKYAMLDRVLLERLDKKAGNIMALLKANQDDWEETTYQWLGQHFGFKLNDPAFLRLTQVLPWKILQKHQGSQFQIEALLFGTAGLIPEIPPATEGAEHLYITVLRKEYHFLAAKYRLRDSRMNAHEWKFLRQRPAGFPTVRIAQLASLLNRETGLFSLFLKAGTVADLTGLFHLKQSDYWTKHFLFGKPSKSQVPAMGREAINLLIINAVVPLMVAYAKQRQQPELLDKAIGWLSAIPSENNHITRNWESLGMRVNTAADSQALIEWYNHYCSSRKCLECTVGALLVRSV